MGLANRLRGGPHDEIRQHRAGALDIGAIVAVA
jgi:hypothetical protein